MIRPFLVMLFLSGAAAGFAIPANEWRPAPYGDEKGYQGRIQGMVARIAAQDYLHRSMAKSSCPDTGLPVITWALAGEEIISPYTGRRYVQGDTGYFGPKRRGPDGRITAFGGDPLKQALPPATAALLLNPDDAVARAYVSIPGNLRQQYHFACVNWLRLLGLVGPHLSPAWHEEFQAAVASYEETRRPSDGAIREYQPLERTENLVGRVEEHLGGGGTENHKTMWRTSGLLYAQLLPGGSKISGFDAADAEARTNAVLGTYARQLFSVGNGEYDSSTYYPYSFRGFANLYDFSPKTSSRDLAQAVLDYLFATYGLKVFNGVHTGPQRRGWVDGHQLGEMDRHLWAWAAGAAGYSTVPVDPGTVVTSLHQATTHYRPNQVITDLIAKNVPRRFEAWLNHPSYGMQQGRQQPEYFYCGDTFALGSVQLDAVNNSGQQTTWSLNVRSPGGSLIFGGGQPRWLHPEGHSPYDQWIQKRGALLLMTAPTGGKPGAPVTPALERLEQLSGPQSYSRQAAFTGPLRPATAPGSADLAALATYFASARSQAASWLFIPRSAVIASQDGRHIISTADTDIVITPFNPGTFWLELPAGDSAATPAILQVLEQYRVLVVPGDVSGFAIEAVEGEDRHHLDRGSLQVSGLQACYRSIAGDTLELHYQPSELRPAAVINGAAVNWSEWAGGAVCESRYLKIKDGRMWVSNGRNAYEMEYREDGPVWHEARR